MPPVWLRPVDIKIHAIQWTGDNDAEVSEFLGTDDWKLVRGVVTQVGWWLFSGQGSVWSMSNKVKEIRFSVEDE